MCGVVKFYFYFTFFSLVLQAKQSKQTVILGAVRCQGVVVLKVDIVSAQKPMRVIGSAIK